MVRWAVLLGGLLTWAAHFFLLYGFASIFPGKPLASGLTIAATFAALVVDSFILRAGLAMARSANHRSPDRWIGEVGVVGAAISMIAILWQLLPALF